jgi:hypothetical protein
MRHACEKADGQFVVDQDGQERMGVDSRYTLNLLSADPSAMSSTVPSRFL